MIRHTLRRHQRFEQFLGLSQAHTHRLASHGKAFELLITKDNGLLELLTQLLAFGLHLSEFGSERFEFVGTVFDEFDQLMSVDVECLPGAVGFFGSPSDGPILSAESGDGIPDPVGQG